MGKRVRDESLDEGNLDEYGVWVKAGHDEILESGDESISDLLDVQRTGAENPIEGVKTRLIPESGDRSMVVNIHEAQEVAKMSEPEKTKNASDNGKAIEDQEIDLDSTDELSLPEDDDDLGGLSDLLLNIDEESENEDTIYLEDDELSIDLDEDGDELVVEQQALDTQGFDELDEDVVIPGLDEEEVIELDDDALPALDDDLPSADAASKPAESAEPETADIELHSVEESGLDEFLRDNAEDDKQIFDDDTDLEIDLGPEFELEGDAASIFGDSGGDKLPGSETGLSKMKTDDIVPSDETAPELEADSDEMEMTIGGFDDVAAITQELSEPSTEIDPPAEKAEPDGGSASQVLLNIEEELHAIRSELTDLRHELSKLRGKGLIGDEEAEAVASISDATERQVEDLGSQAAEEAAADDSAGVKGGFFEDDEDETIALTGDELDNILNTAEFTEEAGEPTNPDELDMDVSLGSPSETLPPADEGAVDFAYEDKGGTDEFPPIEEISLEEMSSESLPDAAPEVSGEAEIENLAKMDIEKELAGIEELKDEEEDIEVFSGSDLDNIELDIPEDFAASAGGSGAELESPAIDGDLSGDLDEFESVADMPPVPAPALESPADAASAVPSEISFNLKQEIKAVLSYMDQLLESLPEEKIEEFARSEHFDVYKKLFDELGL